MRLDSTGACGVAYVVRRASPRRASTAKARVGAATGRAALVARTRAQGLGASGLVGLGARRSALECVLKFMKIVNLRLSLWKLRKVLVNFPIKFMKLPECHRKFQKIPHICGN